MPKHKKGKRALENQARIVGTNIGGFGMRRSAHCAWPLITENIDRWAYTAGEMLWHFGSDRLQDSQVRFVSKSRHGKQREVIVETEEGCLADAIIELRPDKNTIFFDPLPYKKGKPWGDISHGWATYTNVHPLSLFPEAEIYWSIGANKFQGLFSWNLFGSVDGSCFLTENRCDAQNNRSVRCDDLLIVPGSYIHQQGLPSLTATVEYDNYTRGTHEPYQAQWHNY